MQEIAQHDVEQYFDLLKEHLEHTYSPYSNFPVAALVLLKDGKYFMGINIENVSFGATNCAERTAIFTAINAGYRKHDFAAIFVIAKTKNPIAPCSICRQVFVEFFEENTPVYLANQDGKYITYSSGALIPYAFSAIEYNK